MRRGAAGVVTDGALRDTPAIRALDLPVYHRASHAATFGRLHMPLDHQVPIACAGVTVLPGDVVVGDGEGVVVVPAALAAEVAADAVQQELEEEWAAERVDAGESTEGVFPIAKARRRRIRRLAGHPQELSRRRPTHATTLHRDRLSFRHANPIPAASRVGPLLVSSIIAPRDPGRRPHARRRRRPAGQPVPPRRRDARRPPAPTGATSPR